MPVSRRFRHRLCRRGAVALALLAMGALAPGCRFLTNWTATRGVEQGYTVILPGIEGPSPAGAGMVAGLRAGAPASAVEIYDWTTGLPPLLLVHLRYLDRNRHQAEIVASKIVAYQDQYPGRPVHLIGHSAGAGIALMAVEALPEGRQVSSITLLAAAVSPRYDLRPALARTERGIWNYSSLGDVAFLMAATTVCGTVDGVHGPAAGAIGFRLPRDATPGEQALYAQKLHERPYQLRMLADLNWGGHFGGTTAWFASHELALVMQESEPEQRWGHSLAGRMAEVGPAP